MKRRRRAPRPRLAPLDDLARAVQRVLRENPPEIKPEYAEGVAQFDGHCYAASEAYFHLANLNGRELQPMQLRRGTSSHWWLVDDKGRVVDLTLGRNDRPRPGDDPGYPYEDGVARPFRWTKDGPSRRARHIMEAVEPGSARRARDAR